MKKIYGISVICLFLLAGLPACGKEKAEASYRLAPVEGTAVNRKVQETSKNPAAPAGTAVMEIEADGIRFAVILYENETAAELAERLPMTLSMSELNGNEKYIYMQEDLPANPQNVETIHAGELMLYGADCLVLFYEDFASSYSYTKIGYTEDNTGLKEALGNTDVQVSFRMKQE